jgi:Ca2+-binding RTX toxin-like protein
MSTRRLHALRMLAAVAALVAPTVGWSWLSPAHAADPTCFGQTATIIGTLDDDTLVGTPDPDVIVGLGGADEIVGLGGDDLICADSDGGSAVGPIPDVLRGGGGNDQLLGIAAAEESSRTLASGDAGDDVMTDADLDYRQAPRGVAVRLDVGVARGWGEDTVSGVRRVIGSDFSDVLIGNDVPLDVEGGCGELGCDVLDGRGGADELQGGAGYDQLAGGAGNDLVVGGADVDSLTPGRGDDRVYGGTGRDTLNYFGSTHGVVVDLAEELATGVGRDRVRGVEWVTGTRFADVIRGNGRDNVIAGFGHGDVLRGRDGNDTLHAGGGPDRMFGGAGRDRLSGGQGVDFADGGIGHDSCTAEQRTNCET